MTDRPGVGVVPVAELRSYDGLSFLKPLIAGALPRAITETLGFELVEAAWTRGVQWRAAVPPLQSDWDGPCGFCSSTT